MSRMERYAFGALLAAVLAVSYAVIISILYFTDPIPHLERSPAFDDVQKGDVITIRCTAYSNRPEFDPRGDPPSKELKGFRVVSDCVTE